MNDENKDSAGIAVGVYCLFGFALWLVALINAPILTLVITMGAPLFAGLLSTSGGGDGREN